MSEIIEKIDQALLKLEGLNTKFDNVEKKVDAIEDEIRCLRQDASKNTERVIRLEEAHKNLTREVDRAASRQEAELKRVERAGSNECTVLQKNMNDKIDKKLLALKLAIYTAVVGAGFSITQFAFGIWRSLK